MRATEPSLLDVEWRRVRALIDGGAHPADAVIQVKPRACRVVGGEVDRLLRRFDPDELARVVRWKDDQGRIPFWPYAGDEPKSYWREVERSEGKDLEALLSQYLIRIRPAGFRSMVKAAGCDSLLDGRAAWWLERYIGYYPIEMSEMVYSEVMKRDVGSPLVRRVLQLSKKLPLGRDQRLWSGRLQEMRERGFQFEINSYSPGVTPLGRDVARFLRVRGSAWLNLSADAIDEKVGLKTPSRSVAHALSRIGPDSRIVRNLGLSRGASAGYWERKVAIDAGVGRLIIDEVNSPALTYLWLAASSAALTTAEVRSLPGLEQPMNRAALFRSRQRLGLLTEEDIAYLIREAGAYSLAEVYLEKVSKTLSDSQMKMARGLVGELGEAWVLEGVEVARNA